MGRYTKYKLYQKYETRGSQEAIPVYPNTYSIDGDGTMPVVIVEENSRDCGYTGETQPIYRWYTLPIDTYYYCDACQDAQYKWVNLPISQDWECVGTTKYYKQKKQVSVDGGSTWTDVTPPQYQRGALYEYSSQSCGYRTRTSSGSPYCTGYDKYVDVYSQYSTDGGNTWQTTATTPTMVEHNSAYCGYIEPQYRTTTGATYCSGYNKYVPVYSQVSYDGGVTWETTATTQTLVERNSPDCGYAYKLRGTFSDAHYYDIVCNNDSVLRMYEAQDNHVTGMSYADIGTCVTEITSCAFDNGVTYPNLVSVTLPNTLTTIGDGAFIGCSALTSITIPDSVTSFGRDVFASCYSLRNAVIGNGVTTIPRWTFRSNTSLTNVTIGSGVTTIGEQAFLDCSNLRNITIPNNVTTIDSLAFWNCGLTTVTVPNSVSSINASFEDCLSLTSATIGGTSTALPNVFAGCTNLRTVTIPNTVTELYFTFYECTNLRSLNSNVDGLINIPTSVTSIGGSAFRGCSSFTSIVIPSSVTSIGGTAFENCSGLTSVTIPDSVTSIAGHAFGECSGLTSVEIGTGITSMSDMVFQRCSSITSYTINATIPPSIGEWTFNDSTGCPIYVPCDSVEAYKTASDWHNFKNRIRPIQGTCTTKKFKGTYSNATTYQMACDSNTTLTSGDTRPSGYDYAIMTSAEVGDCVTTVGARAFADCTTLTTVEIGSGATTIGGSAFYGCSGLTSITMPTTVTDWGSWVFLDCRNLRRLNSNTDGVANLPSGLTSISDSAFGRCISLTSVTIPDSVTTINYAAFAGCSGLTNLTIPDSVTTIGQNAFYDCSGLTSIVIPSGVTNIGMNSFTNCSSLTSITVNATTPPTLGTNGTFANTNNCPIYVPCESLEAYRTAEEWSDYYNINRVKPIPGSCSGPTPPPSFNGKFYSIYLDETQTIPEYIAYSADCDNNTTLTSGDTRPSGYENTAMTEAIIGSCVTTIGDGAFMSCTNLESVEIPSSITSINYEAFYYCTNLTSVTIPNSVTTIGNYAFYGCRRMATCTIGSGVRTLGEGAFYCCSGLTSVTIPNGITSISYRLFERCSGLTSVSIPDSVTSIGTSGFSWCRSLTSVTIPNSVTTIGDYAFDYCGLISVTIGTGITRIGKRAFDVKSITSVTIYATTPPTLGDFPFAIASYPIYVPAQSVNAYKNGPGWSTYKDRIQAIP